jgi:mycothiol system anti-sigma-R factor
MAGPPPPSAGAVEAGGRSGHRCRTRGRNAGQMSEKILNCQESFEMLYRFLDDDLDGVSYTDVEYHLKLCRPCWDRFEFEKMLKARFKKSCNEPLPETLVNRIKSLLEKY